MAVLHNAHGVSYIAGAPRYRQRGAVFKLRPESKEATFVQEGEQVPCGERPSFLIDRALVAPGEGRDPVGQSLGSWVEPSSSECLPGSPYCGPWGAQLIPCVIDKKLLWNKPILGTQEGHKQGSALLRGGGGSPWYFPGA